MHLFVFLWYLFSDFAADVTCLKETISNSNFNSKRHLGHLNKALCIERQCYRAFMYMFTRVGQLRNWITMALQIKLCHRDQVSPAIRSPFIESGYMPCGSSLASYLCSAFILTNETINFWTHFLTFLVFVIRLWTFPVDYIHDEFTLPLLALGISACIYPLVSSFAHLLNQMSEECFYFCFFVDYAAVSLYSLGSAIGYNYYSFPPDLIDITFHEILTPLAITTGIIATILSCESRMMKSNLGQLIRVAAFILPYAFCHYPLIYRMMFCQGADCSSDALSHHRLEMLFVGTAIFFLVFRIPEYFAPGRFDIFGHSHQLFHVLSATSTYHHLMAILNDMQNSRADLHQTSIAPPTIKGTLLPLGLLTVANFIVVIVFSMRIRKRKVNDKKL